MEMGKRGRGAQPRTKQPALNPVKLGVSWQNRRLGRASRVIAFLEGLPVTKGVLAGTKMRLLPSQRDFIRAVYLTDPHTRRRRVKLAVLSEPRGNGKTGLLAGIALAHLLGPEAEPRGEVYSAAVDRLQAGILFAEMVAILDAVPELGARCNVQSFHKKIQVLDGAGGGSLYESLSSDARRGHGLAPSLWVFDELGQVPGRELLDALQTSTGKRREALGVIISTQAPSDAHPLSALIDDGLLETDPTLHVQLHAAPADADPFDEEVWRACNPALGVFLDLEDFRTQAARAARIPSYLSAFKNLRLNQRVDANVRYLSDGDWMRCASPVDPDELAGRPCWAGLDLSATTDLTALVLYFPDDDGAVLPFFWLPGDALAEREHREQVTYRLWRDGGLLETNPGRAIDYRAIVRRLGDVAERFDIRAVAYDRKFFAHLERLLDEAGIALPLEPFGQGMVSMAPAVQALEAAVLDRRIRHGGHPILRWNVANAAVETDAAGNRKISKRRAIGHVDGLISLLMAIGCHTAAPPAPVKAPSVYQTRGLVFL